MPTTPSSEWAQNFYSVTDRWWGPAEAAVDAADTFRAAMIAEVCEPGASVLELGCGYGSTAAATAQAGFRVTAIDFADRVDRATAPTVNFVRDDFTKADFGQRFDLVSYWDGFGIGTDAQQQELLDRIGLKWLTPGGRALIEVFDPAGWRADDGLSETMQANPAAEYHYSLGHRRSFDAEQSIATDTWWELDADPSVEYSQHLRCYSPTAFEELVEPTHLQVDRVLEAGRSDWSYLTILRAARPRNP